MYSAGYLSSFGHYAPLHNWRGVSGSWYPHSVYPIASIPSYLSSVNYIFARQRPDRLFDPLYIGESGEGDQRINNHEKLLPAVLLGATHVHVHLLATTKFERLQIETDLRRNFWTPLNRQPNGSAALARVYAPPFGNPFLK